MISRLPYIVWNNPQFKIQYLTKNQIAAITPHQIGDFFYYPTVNLTPIQIQELSKIQLAAFSDNQLPFFNQNQVQAFTKSQIQFLTPQQVVSLYTNFSTSQIALLTPAQLALVQSQSQFLN